ncbi:hypothetical protein [Actinomadura formosensis]|uniref:hypothetical protein n=1 Tax=Actinomadura formosensis TaxID=60706 RepID=UPI001040ECEC|nr:hypothetical protein [Actinomadura formosensis]
MSIRPMGQDPAEHPHPAEPPVRVERSRLVNMGQAADAGRAGAAAASGGPGLPAPRTAAAVRLAGVMLAAGAAVWAVGIVVVGEEVKKGITLVDCVTGLGYVAGLFCLALVVLYTGGTGARKGRAFPIAVLALLPGAFLFNLLSLSYVGHTYEDLPPWLAIIDACWPLSNLGMLVLGIAVLKVGRYRGPLRWYLPLCGLWLPVSMAGQAAGGGAATLVSAAWLLGTYTVVGVWLALRPADVLAPR